MSRRPTRSCSTNSGQLFRVGRRRTRIDDRPLRWRRNFSAVSGDGLTVKPFILPSSSFWCVELVGPRIGLALGAAALGIFYNLVIWKEMQLNFFIANLTQLNLTYVILLELSAKDVKDASNQILVKNLLGTTKSQLCRKILSTLLLNTPAGLAVSEFQIFSVLGKQQL